MAQIHKTRQLLKILIGAAWLDGVIHPEERHYLQKTAQRLLLLDDPELKPLLSELKPVSPQECYQWLKDYLGDNPTEQDYLELLDTVSGVLYSDGDIQTQEAQLLNTLQTLDPTHREDLSPVDKVLRTIQGLYRRALAQGFDR